MLAQVLDVANFEAHRFGAAQRRIDAHQIAVGKHVAIHEAGHAIALAVAALLRDAVIEEQAAVVERVVCGA